MTKKKRNKIIISICIIVIVIILMGIKIAPQYIISELKEGQIENQVQMQYDKTKYTNTRQKLNIDQFKKVIENMSEERYKQILKLVNNATIEDIHKLYNEKKFTCEELVTFYLKRIAQYDVNKLNSIIELNSDAIVLARQFDRGLNKGKLQGIPVMLKGNIGTNDRMNTTAGAVAISNLVVKQDAFIATKLRKEGAIILGKTNLSEWAYYMSSNAPSGYSALGGQTHNAYGKFDVGGSSSGAAVAISANLATVSIGTETAGSIIYPSSQNSVVGIKPSLGLVSRNGIIPLTTAQDTAGIITKNVEDAMLVLKVITSYDKEDPVTAESRKINISPTNYAKNDSIKGIKIAVVKSSLRKEENEILKKVEKELSNMGVKVTHTSFYKDVRKKMNTETALSCGFKIDVNKYLNKNNIKGIRNLQDIVNFNKKDLKNRAPYGQNLLEEALNNKTTTKQWEKIVKDNREVAGNAIDSVLKDSDVILSISNDISDIYAAAGYPAITIPVGYKSTGEPIGITLIASKFQEDKLFWIANYYENNTHHRKDPVLK
ncbi:amidase family protein [Clostridium sp. Marseille-Q2269]|uniref:amidase family protein n=1 Tax=Clostridium sp. Marseille-Q2269 TaxID=2942205 RepID=UPI002072C65E|nr:amidase family protein [Clostridium sp. Marseille-Q2269]